MLLVRHGHTATTGRILPGRAPGLRLAARGRREAAALGERVRRLGRVAAVYASPLERAGETAGPIARAAGVPVQVDPGLNECDYGRWTGMALRALARRPEWRTVQRYPSGFRFPGGESFVEMQARITGALAALVGRHPGRTIVAVSHADPIKAALAHALGLHLDLFQRIGVAPGSVSVVAYRSEGPLVLAVNSRGEGLAELVRP